MVAMWRSSDGRNLGVGCGGREMGVTKALGAVFCTSGEQDFGGVLRESL